MYSKRIIVNVNRIFCFDIILVVCVRMCVTLKAVKNVADLKSFKQKLKTSSNNSTIKSNVNQLC